MTCRAETAEAQMMKTGDFNAAPAKEGSVKTRVAWST